MRNRILDSIATNATEVASDLKKAATTLCTAIRRVRQQDADNKAECKREWEQQQNPDSIINQNRRNILERLNKIP
jgi:hypothetical protein